MLGIPRRYSHFVFGTIQAGLTSLIAAGIASYPLGNGQFFSHWLISWLISWAAMLPFVLFAALAIRRMSILLTKDDASAQEAAD
jgi:hypothetical protein